MRGPFESLGISYQNDERSARETTSLLGMGLFVGLDFCASAECLHKSVTIYNPNVRFSPQSGH